MDGGITVKVVIDPGHGGKDPGAGEYPVYEKYIVLGAAWILYNYLRSLGIEVSLTRKSDDYVTLSRRVSIANIGKADLFISLHCNSAENPHAKGYEVLVYNRHSRAGEIAEKILLQFSDLPLLNRGIKERKDLYVLKHTRMPAILIELGFISNQDDYIFLTNPEDIGWQMKLLGDAIESLR